MTNWVCTNGQSTAQLRNRSFASPIRLKTDIECEKPWQGCRTFCTVKMSSENPRRSYRCTRLYDSKTARMLTEGVLVLPRCEREDDLEACCLTTNPLQFRDQASSTSEAALWALEATISVVMLFGVRSSNRPSARHLVWPKFESTQDWHIHSSSSLTKILRFTWTKCSDYRARLTKEQQRFLFFPRRSDQVFANNCFKRNSTIWTKSESLKYFHRIKDDRFPVEIAFNVIKARSF